MEAEGAAVLRSARTKAGLSQLELGARAGIPQSVISAYERGRREPTVASLRHLIQAAGYDLEIDLKPRPTAAAPFTGPVGRRLQRRRTEARQLLTERGYSSPAVFGSVARGTDNPTSDIDLLVDLPPNIGLTQLTRTALDLEALLGVQVDLIPRTGLRDRVAREVEADLVAL